MSKQKIQLSDHFDYSRLIRFVLPCIGTMLFTSIYGIVDGLCVSNFVGKTAFAAVNLIMPAAHAGGHSGLYAGHRRQRHCGHHAGRGRLEDSADRYFSLFLSTALDRRHRAVRAGAAAAPAGGRCCWVQRARCWTTPLRYGRILMLSPAHLYPAEYVPELFCHRRKAASGLLLHGGRGLHQHGAGRAAGGHPALGRGGCRHCHLASARWWAACCRCSTFSTGRTPACCTSARPQFDGGVLLNACVNGSSELMTNLSMSLVNILYNYQLLRFAGENGVAAYGVIMYACLPVRGSVCGLRRGQRAHRQLPLRCQ